MSGINDFRLQDLFKPRLKDLFVIRDRIRVDAGPATDRIVLVRGDNLPNVACRLVSAYIFAESGDGTTSPLDIACKVSVGLDYPSFAEFDCGNSQEIAWITGNRSTPSIGNKDFNDVIDPRNLSNTDVVADFWSSVDFDVDINYMFIFERVDLTDDQALVTTVGNIYS